MPGHPSQKPDNERRDRNTATTRGKSCIDSKCPSDLLSTLFFRDCPFRPAPVRNSRNHISLGLEAIIHDGRGFSYISVSAKPWISRQRGHFWGTLNNCVKRQHPGSGPSLPLSRLQGSATGCLEPPVSDAENDLCNGMYSGQLKIKS